MWLDDGTDYMKVKTQKISCDWAFAPTIEHLVGKAHYYYDLQERFLEWKAKNLMFDSHADFSTFLTNIESWHDNSELYLSVVRDSSDNKVSYDGTNTRWQVALAKGLSGLELLGAQDITNFKIKSITFHEVG